MAEFLFNAPEGWNHPQMKNFKFVGGGADGKILYLPVGQPFAFLNWESFDPAIPEEKRYFTETYELIAGQYYYCSDHTNNLNNPKPLK